MSTIEVTAVEAEESEILVAEQIAKTVAGIGQIGRARNLLELAGFTANITGQRILVNQQVEARFVIANGRSWWEVHSIDGSPPVWVVGAQVEQGNWMGAVE